MEEVSAFIERQDKWEKELEKLRSILVKTPLKETIKWNSPVYTHNNKNILGLGSFKNYCALWFFQGALLKDEANLLINAQEGKTKALRQWRFTSCEEIDETLILMYIQEAIENQKNGREIKPETKKKLVLAEELKKALEEDDELQVAFDKLTPGRQKEYAEFILEAKRDATRLARLDKIKPMIIEGIGLHDKYRNC